MMCYVCGGLSTSLLIAHIHFPELNLTAKLFSGPFPFVLSSFSASLPPSPHQRPCHLSTEQYILGISWGLSCKFKQWENQWVPVLIHEKGCHRGRRKSSMEMWLFRSHPSREEMAPTAPLNLSIKWGHGCCGLPKRQPLKRNTGPLFPA